MRLGTNAVLAATMFGLVLISVSLVSATSMWAGRLGVQVTATTGHPDIEVIDADGYVVSGACCPCCGGSCSSTEIEDVPMSDVWVDDSGGGAGARAYLLTHKPVIWVGALMRSNGTVPVTVTGIDVYVSANHDLSTSVEVFVYGPYTSISEASSWGLDNGCGLPISNQAGVPMTLWPDEWAVVWVKIVLTHHHHCGNDGSAQGPAGTEPECGCPLPIRVDVSITPVTEGSQ